MKLRSILFSGAFSGLALGGAALLVVPGAPTFGFVKLATSLGLGQRDVRIHDNFADAASNNNMTFQSQFPAQRGAELAVWKGIVEWGSGPHGNGTGDPTQTNLGDGGANFDGAWMGKAESPGMTNHNIVAASSVCSPGVVSFTEQPSHDGWRISLCDNGRIWSDGPDVILGTEFDIQSAAAHEYGHALGLGHSTDTTATMHATIAAGDVGDRSIEADDIAGVQCIYGVKSPTKPVITNVTASGTQVFTVTITGSNFAATGNDVWFTNRKITAPGIDPRVRFNNLNSSNNGTKITVLMQATSNAGSGDCLVKITGMGGDKLSNAFPFQRP